MRIDIENSEMFTAVLESTINSKIHHPITGLTNDSRQIKKGDLYVAMNGQYNDGHKFLSDVYKKGAAAAIVQESNNEIDFQQIQVNNTMDMLKKLATKWRKNFDIPIVAITGSNGKTSSKDLLLHILSNDLKVKATKGNLNTAISPLSGLL